MSGRVRHSRTSALIDLFACFLIPAYTLLFAGSTAWFRTNFSVRAVLGETYYRGFFVWGVLSGGYYLMVLLDLACTLPSRRSRAALRILTIMACACLGTALVVPYLPDDWPQGAQLHVVLAFSSCVLLMLAILMVLRCYRRKSPRHCRALFICWLAIVMISALLFSLSGIVSSALELFFAISTSLLLRALWRQGRQR